MLPVLLMEPVGPLNRAAVALNSNRLGGLFGCYIELTDPVESLLEIPRRRGYDCRRRVDLLPVLL